ncbi:unnamed protein product [Rotaria sp. Silwood1]|nr:unnamed protein product [Rotaria sp. Silwood1]CAF4755973.1 unnamed protein product [Rotaria sp. Silwood1]CAF4906577.1 unnamed protein product [Rotaria sp. Silwood1]
MKLQQIHVEVPLKGSYFVEIFPYTINVDDVNIRLIKVHIHYPRLWNSLQEWFINIDTTKAQVYFVFEHKNFLQEATPMDLTIKVCFVEMIKWKIFLFLFCLYWINDVLVRLVIPESNRMYYIVKRIDAHKRFYELDGIKLQISLSDTFDKR